LNIFCIFDTSSCISVVSRGYDSSGYQRTSISGIENWDPQKSKIKKGFVGDWIALPDSDGAGVVDLRTATMSAMYAVISGGRQRESTLSPPISDR